MRQNRHPNRPRPQEFYEFATTRLSPGGVLVTQSGAAAVHLKDECFTVIHKTLKSVFEHVSMSLADVPSFGCCWGFNLASDSSSFATEVCVCVCVCVSMILSLMFVTLASVHSKTFAGARGHTPGQKTLVAGKKATEGK